MAAAPQPATVQMAKAAQPQMAQPVMAQAQPAMAQAQPAMAQMAVPAGGVAGGAAPTTPITKAQCLQVLASQASFTVIQEVNLFEAITQGCYEAPNTYMVYDTFTMTKLFAIKENSNNLCRCCCAPNHPLFLEFHLLDQAGKPANGAAMWTLEREGLCSKCTCCCNCGLMCRDGAFLHDGHLPATASPGEVQPGSTRVIGSMSEKGCCDTGCGSCCMAGCVPTVWLFDGNWDPEAEPKQPPEFAVEGPCCFGGCSELCCKSTFPVSKLTEGYGGDWPKKLGDAATIQKLAPQSLGEACQEMWTDSDKYVVEIHDATIPVEKRVSLLATAMLMDFMFFEQDNGMCTCNIAEQKITFTCFEMYCWGCLYPCTVTLSAKGEGEGGGN